MPDPDFTGFDRVAIIGLGLIGGSIALGLKSRGRVGTVTAFDLNRDNLDAGLSLGVCDETFGTVRAACEHADVVVLAVPVKAMASVMPEIDPQAVVTDVGSVKSAVIDAAKTSFGELPAGFVPGHPIAGSEQHGVRAARADLFENHRVILTPTTQSSNEAVTKVTQLWQALDAEVIQMEPDHHDEVLAQTSHLPHLLAYGLVDTLSRQGDSLEIFQYAAGGFRDFSRIAASDPVMWRDIFDANGDKVLEILAKYQQELDELRQLIESRDTAGLEAIFTRAKEARDYFSDLQAQRSKGNGK